MFRKIYFVKILLDLQKIARTAQRVPSYPHPVFPCVTVSHYMVFVTINEPISPLNLQTSFFFFGKNFNFDFSLIKWNLFFVLKVTIENIKIPVASESSIWAKILRKKAKTHSPNFSQVGRTKALES